MNARHSSPNAASPMLSNRSSTAGRSCPPSRWSSAKPCSKAPAPGACASTICSFFLSVGPSGQVRLDGIACAAVLEGVDPFLPDHGVLDPGLGHYRAVLPHAARRAELEVGFPAQVRLGDLEFDNRAKREEEVVETQVQALPDAGVVARQRPVRRFELGEADLPDGLDDHDPRHM